MTSSRGAANTLGHIIIQFLEALHFYSHFLNSMPDFRIIITVGGTIAYLGFKGLVDDRHEEHG